MDFARSFGLDSFCSYSHWLNACKGWELIMHPSMYLSEVAELGAENNALIISYEMY